jgi:hypothetical protein
MNPFTKHPASAGETYGEHFTLAWAFGLRMIWGGMAALIHGLFPFVFTVTGSTTVNRLHQQLIDRRAKGPPTIV